MHGCVLLFTGSLITASNHHFGRNYLSYWTLFLVHGSTLDYNKMISQEEKKGGRAFGSSSNSRLLSFLSSNGLTDLGHGGNKYTRSNKCEGLANIKERFDHGVANI